MTPTRPALEARLAVLERILGFLNGHVLSELSAT